MPVGNQASSDSINNKLTTLSLNMRAVMDSVANLNTNINGQGNGLQTLTNIGFSTVPSSLNPGGVSDAQFALTMISYLNTVAAIYYGTATQGTTFNFNQELSQLWAGQ